MTEFSLDLAGRRWDLGRHRRDADHADPGSRAPGSARGRAGCPAAVPRVGHPGCPQRGAPRGGLQPVAQKPRQLLVAPEGGFSRGSGGFLRAAPCPLVTQPPRRTSSNRKGNPSVLTTATQKPQRTHNRSNSSLPTRCSCIELQ